jgi:hypothetical protein
MKKIIKHYPMTDRLIVIRGYMKNMIFAHFTNIILGPTHYRTTYSYLHFENINHDGLHE